MNELFGEDSDGRCDKCCRHDRLLSRRFRSRMWSRHRIGGYVNSGVADLEGGTRDY